jgi:hypothetical protein
MIRLLVISVLLPMLCVGQQNLVPNGSFEEITSCPTSSAQIHLAVPWMDDIGSAELFNVCNPGSSSGSPHVGVPANAAGNQYAHSGNGYSGIYTYGGPNESNGREYLQVPLTQPLYPGRYEVSFWASLADRFAYAVGSLGAFLSDTLVTRTSFNSLPGVEPSIQSPPGQIFTDKDIWYLITDTFTSRVGGERYLAIGNFKSTAESDTLFVPTSPNDRLKSYYYIDDVSVVALDSVPNSVAETGRLHFNVHPNPSSGSFTVRAAVPLGSGGTLTLHDAQGLAVLRQQVRAGQQSVTVGTEGLAAGVYTLRLWSDDGGAGWEKVVVQ